MMASGTNKLRKLKLTVELVPRSLWRANVRSLLNPQQWGGVMNISRQLSGNVCDLCSQTGHSQGYNWTTETHEVWDYNDKTHTQTLVGIVALCPLCHKAKHWGRTMNAEPISVQNAVLKHFKVLNDMSSRDVDKYLSGVFREWNRRNQHQWTADMEYIYEYISNNPLNSGSVSLNNFK